MHEETTGAPDAMEDLLRFLRDHPRLFVLTGAGISTESGIPDYRDEHGCWKRKQPVTVQEFMRSAPARRRYWARSMAGWPVLADARPNVAHCALARLEAAAHVHMLVTQNVDGLHQRAGSRRVVELHGTISSVTCTQCRAAFSREHLQALMELANPDYRKLRALSAPDGDADLEVLDFDDFKVPVCSSCGGILKPDVVFFGDAVPRERVNAAVAALEQADAMLVAGSSLMTYSGYRFCERAHRIGKPIAAVNRGVTRADPLLRIKLERGCGDVLGGLVKFLDTPAVVD